MSNDAVSIFQEGTVTEQIEELVNYLARSVPEDQQAKFIEPFRAALHTAEGQSSVDNDEQKRKQVIKLVLQHTRDLGLGSDREIEGYFNLLLSHIIQLFSSPADELTQYIQSIVQVISSSSPQNQDHHAVKYRLSVQFLSLFPLTPWTSGTPHANADVYAHRLSNIFNALPRTSPLRLSVYKVLLQAAASNEQLEVLQLRQAPVERWMSEWDVSSEEKSQFLKSLADSLTQSGQEEESYSYLLQHLRILPSTSPLAKDAALETVAAALRIPSIFDFGPLFKFDAVIALKDHPLLTLLRIFANGKVEEYLQWQGENDAILDEYRLENDQLLRKVRSLTLASLGAANIGRDIPYAELASVLHITEAEVDASVIDVIHSALVSGKLSQSHRTFHITRSTTRSFGRSEWELLEKRLLVWKSSLAGVLEVVINARKTAGEISNAPNVANIVLNGNELSVAQA